MDGRERRDRILAIIRRKDGISIGDLAGMLSVSKMTVHRDLDELEDRGLVKKIHGGVVATYGGRNRETGLMEEDAVLFPAEHADKETCLICFRPVTAHLLYSLTLSDGTRRFACCAHCGLLAHLLTRDRITMAMTTDFLSGRPNPAQNSFFLMNSAVSPCCHPSVLPFEERELAARFQTGFGGVIGDMAEALEFLKSEMTLGEKGAACPHCPDN